MLIVPPLKEANAANVAWDYIGNGYISPNSVASYDVYRDFDVQPPDINTVTVNGKKTTTITWNVLFNANGCRIKKIENPNAVCNDDNFGHAYGGRPDFYLILPKNIKDSSIRITRYRTKFTISGAKGNKFEWEVRGKDQTPGDFNGGSNATRLPGDSDYENFWKASVEKCGLGTDATCEVDTWRRAGDFGRLLKSWEQDNDADSIRWIVTAEVEEGVDPYKLPFMAGWISYRGDKHKFTVFGPYDHDGDGIPDLEEFKYGLNPKNNDDIQFPKKSKNDAVYGEVTSVKPYINTGEWVGDSYYGDFKYYKDMPSHSGRTTSEMIPTDAGIEFTFKKNELGNKEILPPGVTKANNPNNMKPGQAYINPQTGEVKYSPKPSDRGKTIHFDVQINYPDPRPNNCKMNNSIVKVKGVDIHVVSQASLYNPYYDTTTVKAGEGKDSNSPRDRGGKAFPSGTRFRAETYNKYQNPPTWAKIKNESTGVVTFHPNKWVPASKPNQPENRPVVVYYPDGSTSKDPDSGNNGNPVNAPVIVTRDASESGDLQLHIHKNQNGQEIDYTNGFVFRKNRDVTPQPWIDSWSVREPGDISIRSVCADTTNPMSLKYHLNGINGIKIEGDTPWQHATDEEQEKCRNGQGCAANKLFDSTGNTMERTRGHIKGKPTKIGNYQCTVYALKPNALKRFEEAKKKDSKIESSDGSATNIINTNTFNGLREGVDYTSRTVPIKVHSDAHYYNPQYTKVSVQAGNTEGVMNAAPVSQTGANGVAADDQSQKDLVQDGTYLPKGTWFELKKYSKHKDSREKPVWSNFEGDQSNKKNGSNEAKDKTTDKRYGKITFKPEKTTEARDYLVPVIVHYPDGSTSEDSDSGNLGKPVFASVNVLRSHDEDANNLHLNVSDREGGGNWNDPTINLSKNEELTVNNSKGRWLDSWSQYKPGKINLRTICYRNNPDGTKSHYQSGGIAGITMQNVEKWDHTENPEKQKKCEENSNECEVKHLYDDYISNGNSQKTTERTRGWIKGTAKETGDYECVVYAIKEKQFSKDTNNLLTNFDNAVKKLNKDASKNNTDPLKDFQWNISGSGNNIVKAKKGVDYESRTIPIHIHTQAHNYNPVYDKVNVRAGDEVQSGLPKNKKPTGKHVNTKSLAYGAISDSVSFPDGTWFELKKDDGSAASSSEDAYDWSFWKNGQKDSNAPRDNNNPLNHNGNDTGIGAGSGYGNVTFHPDVTVTPKDHYKTHVVVHYPDGSTSEDPDAGNNQFKHDDNATNTMNPVYAPVKVTDLGYSGNDLRMSLTKSKDTNSVLNGSNDLTVMKGIGLIRNPFVQAWSVKNKTKIHLRMMCSKDNTNKWSRGLEDTLNMHLGHDYGENTPEWTFATESQQKDCRENGNCSADHVLYGMLNANNTQAGSVESSTARREEEIEGAPKETGTYVCSVFALKDNALTAFNQAVKDGIPQNDGSYSSTDMWNVKLAGVAQSRDWDRISFKVHVVEQFKLPKTGGEDCVNWNMLMSVLCVIGTGVMAAGFFLEQTKWGRAMLDALLRKTLIKDFICKTAKKLRALRRRSERWRC